MFGKYLFKSGYTQFTNKYSYTDSFFLSFKFYSWGYIFQKCCGPLLYITDLPTKYVPLQDGSAIFTK